jgi:putative drug exporter of the RND superfamily
VVTLPAGKTVSSPGVRGTPEEIDRRLHGALPGARIASYASTGNRAFVSRDGRTTFALIYPRRDPDSTFGENPKAESAARKALGGVTVAGRPAHLTGFDALQKDSGAGNGPGCCSRP